MRQELKAKAQDMTKNLKPRIFLPIFLVLIVSAILQSIYVGIFLSYIFSYMISIFSYNFVNTEKREISDMFKDYGKTDNLIELIKSNFIMIFINAIFIILIFIGNILTVVINPLFCIMTILASIPTIFIGFFYFCVPYLLKDTEYKINVSEAYKLSRDMMSGHKWELFVLELSFIGHFLLSIITLGIYTIWFMPYYSVTLALYYKRIKSEYLKKTNNPLADQIRDTLDDNVEIVDDFNITDFDTPEDVLNKDEDIFIDLKDDDIILPNDEVEEEIIFEEIIEDDDDDKF